MAQFINRNWFRTLSHFPALRSITKNLLKIDRQQNIITRKYSLSMEYWKEKWGTGDLFWHRNDVNNYLLAHFSHFINAKNSNGSKECQIFVPLCGKSIDLKWLYDGGHKVIGVEGLEQPILDFFKEQSLEFVKECTAHGVTYSTADGRLKIFNCDLFAMDPLFCGTFDGIWDRGSLVAISPDDRKKYSVLLKKLQRPNCAHLVVTVEYDQSKFEGPPKCVPVDEIKRLFCDVNCDIQVLETLDLNADPSGLTPQKRWKVAQLDPCHELVAVINRKPA